MKLMYNQVEDGKTKLIQQVVKKKNPHTKRVLMIKKMIIDMSLFEISYYQY
jgi:hypothetical protein